MRWLPSLILVASFVSFSASAQAPLLNTFGGVAGYGSPGNCLGYNDDGFRQIDISSAFPQGLRLFAPGLQTSVFVNTNGSISFGGGNPTFITTPFPIMSTELRTIFPMIAPYWADADIRRVNLASTVSTCGNGEQRGDVAVTAVCHNPPENGVWWHVESASGGNPGRLIVTWDRVQRYSGCGINDGTRANRMSFQLIVIAPTGCSEPGDFDVEFRFNRCEWELTESSNTYPQSGFDSGNGTDFYSIPGSREAGIGTRLCTMSNLVPAQPGVWRFPVRGGLVLCPGSGEPCTVPGAVGVCAQGLTACSSGALSADICRPLFEPRAQDVCDGFDDDCDGMTDEQASCANSEQVCDRGLCVDRCSAEGFCFVGDECSASGLCVDPICASVTCESNQICLNGSCVDACTGVVCPSGERCAAGRCVNACESVDCGPCGVCEQGACIARCQNDTSCDSGEVCLTTGDDVGMCLDGDCVGVPCDGTQECRDGTCVPRCTGVVCPYRQICEAGQCVADPNPPVRPDAGVIDGAVVDGSVDAVDAGPAVRRGADSCSCRVTNRRLPFMWGSLLVALMGLFWLKRVRTNRLG